VAKPLCSNLRSVCWWTSATASGGVLHLLPYAAFVVVGDEDNDNDDGDDDDYASDLKTLVDVCVCPQWCDGGGAGDDRDDDDDHDDDLPYCRTLVDVCV